MNKRKLTNLWGNNVVDIPIFISGHRDITNYEFNEYYKNKLDNALKDSFTNNYLLSNFRYTFYIGDCEGLDYMASRYIYNNYIGSKFLKELVICVLGDDISQYDEIVNHPKVRIISGFKSHEERDCFMTENTEGDWLFVREGKWDSGTAQNFVRRKFHNYKND